MAHHLGEQPRRMGQAEGQDLELIEGTLPLDTEVSRGVRGHGDMMVG
jgi:hypothetical protein